MPFGLRAKIPSYCSNLFHDSEEPGLFLGSIILSFHIVELVSKDAPIRRDPESEQEDG
jgi:hypothetical protein